MFMGHQGWNVQISVQKICRQDMSGLNFAKFKIYWHLTVCNTVDWISLRNEMFYHTREMLNQARARDYGDLRLFCTMPFCVDFFHFSKVVIERRPRTTRLSSFIPTPMRPYHIIQAMVPRQFGRLPSTKFVRGLKTAARTWMISAPKKVLLFPTRRSPSTRHILHILGPLITEGTTF